MATKGKSKRRSNDIKLKVGDKTYWFDYELYKKQMEYYEQKEREMWRDWAINGLPWNRKTN